MVLEKRGHARVAKDELCVSEQVPVVDVSLVLAALLIRQRDRVPRCFDLLEQVVVSDGLAFQGAQQLKYSSSFTLVARQRCDCFSLPRLDGHRVARI